MFQRESGQRGRHARDRGATAVEYGLILGGVALATAVAIVSLRPVLASALGSASNSQSILSDGSTATPPGGTGGTGGGATSAVPTASSATPAPTTATPTPTTATPTPTTATPTPTTSTPTPTPTTPTPTPTTTTPTPTPSQTALSRQNTWSENYTLPNNGTYSGCTITTNPAVQQSWQQGTCGYTTQGTDRFTYDPWNSLPVGTVVTIVWTISVPGPDITVTRTFVIGA